MIATPEDKEKRRKALNRRKDDKRKRNHIAKDLITDRQYRQRIEEIDKERGGAKNLTREYKEDDYGE